MVAAVTADVDEPSRPANARWFAALTLLILGLAVVVRVIPVSSGLPYTSYVDEGHVLRPTVHMLAAETRDPARYVYPPLLMSAIAASTAAYGAAADVDVSAAAEASERSDYYDAIEPHEMVLIGRLLVLTTAIATVLLTVLIARRMKGRFVALVAGFLVAVLPALVSRSAIVIIDTPATCFVAATIYCALRLDGRRAIVWTVAAGVAAGAAFLSKYTSGSVMLVVLVVLAMQRARPIGTRLLQATASIGAAVVTTLVVMPAWYRHPDRVIDDIQYQTDVYAQASTATSYVDKLLDLREVGWVIVVLAAVGLVALVRNPRSRAVTVGWLVFAVTMVGSLLWTDFQPFRNVLPLTPFLTIAAATGIAVSVDALGQRLALDRGVSRVLATVIAGAVGLAALVWGVRPFLEDDAGVVDSRVEAREWLTEHATAGDRTLIPEELAFLPSELGRIPGEVTVASAADIEELAADDFDFVLGGRFDDGTPVGLRRVAAASRAVRFGQVPTPSAPSLWRRNAEYIEIHELDVDS